MCSQCKHTQRGYAGLERAHLFLWCDVTDHNKGEETNEGCEKKFERRSRDGGGGSGGGGDSGRGGSMGGAS